MITSVIPVPMRVIPGTVIHGEAEVDTVDGTYQSIVIGRNIIVPPLRFYKFFSVWNGMALEHTFYTDKNLNCTNLLLLPDGYSPIGDGQIGLCPISVKVTTEETTETFLFSNSIGFLLSSYRSGVPLGSSSILNNINPEPYITRRETAKVISLATLIEEKTKTSIASRCSSELCYPRSYYRDLTPAAPLFSTTAYQEVMFSESISNTNLILDTVFSHISDIESNNENPSSHRSVYFPYKPDPITMICLKCGPYVNTQHFMPYLSYGSELLSNYVIDVNENKVFDAQTFTYLDTLTYRYDLLYSLVDCLAQLGTTDFSLDIDKRSVAIPYTENRTYSPKRGEPFEEICLTLKDILNDPLFPLSKRLILDKLQTDEIFIWCIDTHNVKHCYYLSIPLFNIGSPSLINMV